MEGTIRSTLAPGMTVDIVLKKDQRTGTLTRGTIASLLTKSPTHPHGIKVRLTNGQIGRVKRIAASIPGQAG
ncbi:MAG: YwbE family protein [Pseudomonadota bacterium]